MNGENDRSSHFPTASVVAGLGGIATAAAAFLGIIFNLSYFLVVGREWLAVLSPRDYVSSTIMFLPLTILGVAIGLLIGEKTRAKLDPEIPDQEQRLIKYKKERNRQLLLFDILKWISAFLTVINLLFGNPYIIIMYAFVMLLPMEWVMRTVYSSSIPDKVKSVASFGCLVSIVSIFGAGMQGIGVAYADIKMGKNDFTITGENGDKYRDATLLRLLEHGTMIQKSSKVIWIPNNGSPSFSKAAPILKEKGIICAYFDYCIFPELKS